MATIYGMYHFRGFWKEKQIEIKITSHPGEVSSEFSGLWLVETELLPGPTSTATWLGGGEGGGAEHPRSILEKYFQSEDSHVQCN